MLAVITPESLGHPPFESRVFTAGRQYAARPSFGTLWEVHDDRGWARYVALDGKPCPHLVAQLSGSRQVCAGRWAVTGLFFD